MIKIEGMHKHFGKLHVLKDINLHIKPKTILFDEPTSALDRGKPASRVFQQPQARPHPTVPEQDYTLREG